MKRLYAALLAGLLTLSLMVPIALAIPARTLEVSPGSVPAGGVVTVSGTYTTDTLVSIKVVDGEGNVVFFGLARADGNGAYQCSFTVPAMDPGSLTVVAGNGADVKTAQVSVYAPTPPPTPSPTPAITPTPTPTATSTPVPSSTPSSTAVTPSATPSITPTATVRPSPTVRHTVKPTATATAARTTTADSTASATATVSMEATASAMGTAMETAAAATRTANGPATVSPSAAGQPSDQALVTVSALPDDTLDYTVTLDLSTLPAEVTAIRTGSGRVIPLDRSAGSATVRVSKAELGSNGKLSVVALDDQAREVGSYGVPTAVVATPQGRAFPLWWLVPVAAVVVVALGWLYWKGRHRPRVR